MLHKVYLLIGGNIGDRQAQLELAANSIDQTAGKIVKRSSVYETAAWGNNDQADFLNQVLLIETSLPPLALLENILLAEERSGRKRTVKNAPRIIDIDILFYDDLVIDVPGLHIPHKEIQNRRFVLKPLSEIAPELLHPVAGKKIKDLLTECKDPLQVDLFLPA